MKIGVVVFPGSNCDHDVFHVLGHQLGFKPLFLWHKDRDLQNVEAVVLPGGFSYGDYLRCGAIAKFSPIMNEIIPFAQKGHPVLGICNGFQILTESGLLPGVLRSNQNNQFICKNISVKVESDQTPFTRRIPLHSVLQIPIAHHDGNFFTSDEELKQIEDSGQVVFRYTNASGEAIPPANPNGSLNNIAGICSSKRNVVGLMPHPERVSEALLGSEQGRILFESLLG